MGAKTKRGKVTNPGPLNRLGTDSKGLLTQWYGAQLHKRVQITFPLLHFILCAWVFYLHMCLSNMCVPVAEGDKAGIGSSKGGVREGREPPC